MSHQAQPVNEVNPTNQVPGGQESAVREVKDWKKRCEDLTLERDRLQAELMDIKKERDQYRKAVLTMTKEDFEFDKAALLALAEKGPLLEQAIEELERSEN